jgi:tetratricopeptide (TPR) repeat protein
MKKSILTIALSFILISLAQAADPAFIAAMQKQLAAKATIETFEQSQEVTNGFMRIAEAAESEWLPFYYAALLKTEAAFRFDIDKDKSLDEALELIKKAEKIAPRNSEITALNGYILMGKISLDPASRGQTMSPEAMQLFGKAINLDRENPRAVSLMSQMELGMSQFFGTGPEKACGMARMSLELYKKEEAKITEEYILPTWGKTQADQVASKCN